MSNQPPVLRFHCFSLSLSIIRSLRPLLGSIKRLDASLVKQIRTAASSVSLNLAESRGRRGKDAVHFQRIALGSAEETTACLLVAEAWGYLDNDQIAECLELLRQLQAMLGKLTRP